MLLTSWKLFAPSFLSTDNDDAFRSRILKAEGAGLTP